MADQSKQKSLEISTALSQRNGSGSLAREPADDRFVAVAATPTSSVLAERTSAS